MRQQYNKMQLQVVLMHPATFRYLVFALSPADSHLAAFRAEVVCDALDASA
jgi:hypothetical protein